MAHPDWEDGMTLIPAIGAFVLAARPAFASRRDSQPWVTSTAFTVPGPLDF